jgi:Na+-translocating ferredoxin:NAD+ oxidoreductase RnfC subunit
MSVMKLDNLKEILRNSGIVGAGGAGFPTYAKLDSRATTIILNCAECEPLLKLHRQVMEHYSREILTALQVVKQTVQANEVIIAIKPSYKKAIEAIKAELEEFPSFRIGLLPEVYPAGDEVITIYEVTGKVVPAGKLPIEVGVTVFNVETMLNAYFAIKNEMPVVDKYITVTGAVKNPVTLKVPLGIQVSQLLSLAGGPTVDNYVLIAGGPMTGNIIPSTEVVTKTTNAILVLPEDHYVVLKKDCKPSIEMKRAMASCCQCRMCTDICPRYLLGHPIEPHTFMRSSSSGVTNDITPYLNTYFCSSCGLCEMYSCFQSLSPRTLMDTCKSQLREHGVPVPKVDTAPVHEQRKGRYVPMSRLIYRLGLSEYNHPAPLSDVAVLANRVKLKLGQHIGAPAVPVVSEGEKVTKGQLIANLDQSKLGCPIHASIDGYVSRITEQYILIEK